MLPYKIYNVTEPAGESVCKMIGHLLGPVGSVLFHKVHYGAVSIEKDMYLALERYQATT